MSGVLIGTFVAYRTEEPTDKKALVLHAFGDRMLSEDLVKTVVPLRYEVDYPLE